MKPIYLIAGLGKTGHSIARYLKRCNKPFVVFDTRKKAPGLAEFIQEFPGVEVYLGELPAVIYPQLQAIITSPGISLDEPFLVEAKQHNIPIIGDIECFAREVKAPVIAITGTNGKSTVTTLVGEMAKAAGLSVAVAGNIGSPVLDCLNDGISYNLWVLELSSFQLDLTYSLKPIAATILNITPDHLDRHHTLEAYRAAKQRIYNFCQFALYNRQDKATIPHKNCQQIPLASPLTNAPAPALNGTMALAYDPWGSSNLGLNLSAGSQQPLIASYGLDKPEKGHWGIVERTGIFFLAYGNECLLAIDELRIKGKHNWQNALAACALAKAAGIDFKSIIKALKTFPGLPHRCEWVRSIDGVDWINDSKGTNVGATVSAICGIGSSMEGKIVLIAGGQGKGAEFSALRQPIIRYVRSVVLIGEDADKIAKDLSNTVPMIKAALLDEAIEIAKSEAKSGDVVLLSPACASFDMFRDFNHRGESFTNRVSQL